jgi:general secretion pathway protein F
MPRFRYTAIDPSSTTVNGRIEASSQSAVVDHLRAGGQMPLSIEQIGPFPSISGAELAALFRRRMSRQTLTLITGQLATLLQAGLALDEALESLADLVERRSEKECVRAVRDRVSGGASLADAMAAQPEVFPDFYVSMVRAGEAGGSLETVLERLADFLERSHAAREHIKSALIYPLILALTCIASIIVLFTFVVPRFRPVFAEAGGALPLAARILLGASEVFQNFWWLAIVLPAGLALLLHLQFKRPASRARWDRLVLRLPVAGALVGQVEVVRFSRTLGTLLKNGVSMMTALAITHETVSNRLFHDAVTRIIERVRIGRGLAEPFAEAKIFPRLAVQLVRVGEESGRQEEMLLKIADILEGETRRSLDRVLALIGPAVMIGLGVVVASVISTILTAILSVYGLAR